VTGITRPEKLHAAILAALRARNGTVVFFASEEASACTSQHYVVDGGRV